MNDKEDQGQVKRKKEEVKRNNEHLFVFALLLLFIIHPLSLHLRIHHHRICQNVQAFLLILDLGQLSWISNALHHGCHLG